MNDLTLENKIKDCEETINELMQKLHELKQEVKQSKNIIEKDIRDISTDEIPFYFTRNEYNKYAWVVNYDGNISQIPCDALRMENNRYFLSAEDAEEFSCKTSFIARCMYFKRRYDRDFIPDWNNQSQHKWYLIYDHFIEDYRIASAESFETSLVYFSSKDVAQKCADWLKHIDEQYSGLPF